MADVVELIRSEVERAGGALPFDRFMALALYAPGVGFYERQGRVGRAGDFYTSVSVGPLFGELLARRISSWLSGWSGTIQLVEAGANDGRLARDILTWFAVNRALEFARMRYEILEPSASQRAAQERTLSEFGGMVRWHSGWESLGNVRGVILSNELLDAMPVKVWRWDASGECWRELGVRWEKDRFVWAELETARADLGWIELPKELLSMLPDGFMVEDHNAAVEWWREGAARLTEGFMLAIDYGLESEEFFSPARSAGTLRAYHQHRVSKEVLENPGEQDLTTHVNFTRVRSVGETAGLETVFDGSQARFLHSILEERLRSDAAEMSPAEIRQYQTLTHPEHLGRPFRALVQSRRGVR